jgi:cation diffusion facilitator family transporter
MAGRPSTRGTVLIAGTANVLVGAIKLAAGIMVGSSAMLAEAAHSAADTLNQALLLISVHRGERPADPRHPFGYGQERYFWSLLAAFGIFIAGAGFSVFEGVLALRRGGGENPLIAFAALAVSGMAEGAPWSGFSSSSGARPAAATRTSLIRYATAPTRRSRPPCSKTAPR